VSRYFPGLLWMKSLRVRMTRTITEAEMTDSRNQPVRNESGLQLMQPHRQDECIRRVVEQEGESNGKEENKDNGTLELGKEKRQGIRFPLGP